MWMKHLVNFRQDCNESLTSALHRFRLFCVGAKVPLNENPMAISIFVFRLYTTQFQEIVTATVEEFIRPQVSNATNNTGDALYAPSNQPNPFNMSWDNFEAILVKKMVNLESSLLYIQENNKKQQTKTSAESSDITIKKRKFTPSSPPLRPSSSTTFKGKSNSDVPRPYYNTTYNNNNSKYSNSNSNSNSNNHNNNNNNRSRAPPSSSSTHHNNYSNHHRTLLHRSRQHLLSPS
ncbi:hypothetical protein G6F56_012876 [Rhizopus delemar]|nr:hypothetical protein G6F56_012876 [Rhizopus delemar]